MQKIVYFYKASTAFDQLKGRHYSTDEKFVLTPNEDCLIILLHKHAKAGINQLLFRGNELIISNKRPQQLCLYIQNISK